METEEKVYESKTCPFCNSTIPVIRNTFRTSKCYFNATVTHSVTNEPINTNVFNIEMLFCPRCKQVSFIARGDKNLSEYCIPLYPTSLAKQFPNYIPSHIIEDYQEAYSILNLSPKASATLCRRCLQEMIENFWGINGENLYQQIEKLKSKVPPDQWKAISGIRSIGNIGAHMKKDSNIIIDIDNDEANKLIKLIELLLRQWYINRHDEQELYNDIVRIADTKKSTKN